MATKDESVVVHNNAAIRQKYKPIIEDDHRDVRKRAVDQTKSDVLKKIDDLEIERSKLKREIDHLNEDVINSLVHEREEILEWRRNDKKESNEKIWKMEKEQQSLKKELHEAKAAEKVARSTADTLQRKYDNILKQHEAALKRIEHLEIDCAGTKNGQESNSNIAKDENSITTRRNEQKDLSEAMEELETREKEQICMTKEESDQNDGTALKQNATNSSKSILLADSGIDLHSLTKLIDDRVDAKIRKCSELTYKEGSEEVIESAYINSKTTTYQVGPTSLETRQLNVIIHGLHEDSAAEDKTVIEELFDTVGLKYTPKIIIDRLGSKSNEKTRPIRLRMETKETKSDFMSNLGRLKNGPIMLRKISITDDYTQDEREEIRRWVAEAKERSRNESGYVWKVRGSPNANNLRLIRIKA